MGLATANGAALHVRAVQQRDRRQRRARPPPSSPSSTATRATVDMGWTSHPQRPHPAPSRSRPTAAKLFFAGDFKKGQRDRHRQVGRRGSRRPLRRSCPRSGPRPTNGTNFSPVFDVTNDGSSGPTSARSRVGRRLHRDERQRPGRAAVLQARQRLDMQSVKVVNGIVWCGGHYGRHRRLRRSGPLQDFAGASRPPRPYSTLAFATLRRQRSRGVGAGRGRPPTSSSGGGLRQRRWGS